jgi:ankyrin repeat protein
MVEPDDPDLVALLKAVRDGDAARVGTLAIARPALVKARGPAGQTALHLAAECNDPKIGVVLIACGADPDATMGESGHTAMSWAITCYAIEFAQALTRLGAKPDLFCAAGMGNLDAVRAWFDEAGQLRPEASRTGSSRLGADGVRLPCPPVSPREQISDALYIASRNAQLDVVRELLRHQPDLTFRAYEGGTALHWAYFGGSREIVDLLIAAGADERAEDDTRHCAPRAFGICTAASWGFALQVERLLRDDPALKEVRTADGRTPLEIARTAGHADVVKLLQ